MSKHIYDEVAYARGIKRNIIMNAQKTFARSYPRGGEVANFLECYQGDFEFVLSLKDAFRTYGKLTEKQYIAVCNMLDKMAANRIEREKEFEAKKALSGWVSEVGKREVFTLKIVKIVEIPAVAYHYRDSLFQDLYIMEDEMGNKFTMKTKTWYDVKEGETYEVKATIKEHTEYKGEKQNVINRPAFNIKSGINH